MRRYFSTTLGQILTIVAGSSIVTFAIFIVLLFVTGSPPTPPWPWQPTYRIASVVQILRGVPERDRESVIAASQRADFSLKLTSVNLPCEHRTLNSRDLESALRYQLPDLPGLTARSCSSDDDTPDIQVLVPIGHDTLEVHINRVGYEPPRLTFPFFGALAFLCVGVAGLSAWAVSRVIRPLRRLCDRAEAFGRDIVIAPIEEEGPLEIRRAAHAFNLMQERITASIEGRTRMLAAISHDLRTPLTRMRLQVDTGKEIVREKLLRDINLMQKMVSSALAFLSTSNAEAEKKEWLDLGALLATLCDEYEDSGARIHYEGPDQIPFLCRPDAMQRVMSNLIENALRFGGIVVVIASVRGKHIMIDVTDDGPGIPEERLKDVIEPFVRLDAARTGQPGSVGLGLSIVNDIVRTHGGKLVLFNHKPSGLTARITFD
ncbi:Signal transduction histidine kinase [Paraburkholderia fungorum]|uniref:histidine kinase n=1 Tax=Paraburkholderia fungorum TaxID=134537 RepID=A0A1H1IPS0_9BURK|nr:ATP-binding protein [Paraburkholderia fungorum]SDR39663.1 Signal transduction histidine kinase [Paraburkholderia fungorum]